MKLYLYNSIRTRLIIFFLAVILIPILTLGLISNLVYTNATETLVNKSTFQMIHQIQNNIEFTINSIENVANYLCEMPEVRQYLTQSLSGSTDRETELKILRQMEVYRKNNPEIAGILLTSENDFFLSNELKKISRDPLYMESWFQSAMNESHTFQYMSRPRGRNITALGAYSADDVVSISRAVVTPDNQVLGVVLIDMRADVFEKMLASSGIGEKGFFYILDDQNEIVYAPANPVVYRIENEWFSSGKTSVMKQIGGETFHMMVQSGVESKWKTVGVFSLSEMLSDISWMQKFSIIICIVTFSLAGVLTLIFTSSIVRPVKGLCSLMKRAESGDLNVRFEDAIYNDEIGELGHSFNHMMEKINGLLGMVYREQTSKRKAELQILQSQIKPHFLYNTLDTISWLADSHGARDVVRLVQALTKLFKIGLSKGKEQIPLSEEFEHVASYMTIQGVRYSDKLSYTITMEEGLSDLLVPTLTTQPIVENAIYHGVKEKRGKGTIAIEAFRRGDKLYIVVQDDGAGMSEEALRRLSQVLSLDRAEYSRQNSGGYGIYNVHSRIRLSYGEEYGLTYHSKAGEGTRVEICLPCVDPCAENPEDEPVL